MHEFQLPWYVNPHRVLPERLLVAIEALEVSFALFAGIHGRVLLVPAPVNTELNVDRV